MMSESEKIELSADLINFIGTVFNNNLEALNFWYNAKPVDILKFIINHWEDDNDEIPFD